MLFNNEERRLLQCMEAQAERVNRLDPEVCDTRSEHRRLALRVELADTDENVTPVPLQVFATIVPDESRVESLLRLPPQVLDRTGEKDYEPISCVRCFADQCRVRRCFP